MCGLYTLSFPSFVSLFWWVIPIVRFFCLSNVEPCPLGSQMQTGGRQCDLGHCKVMGKLVIYTQKLISAQTLMKLVVDGVQRLNLSKSQVWIMISYPRDFSRCWYGPTMPNSHVFQLWHVLRFFDEGQRSSCACRGSSRPGFAASECFKCPGSPCKCLSERLGTHQSFLHQKEISSNGSWNRPVEFSWLWLPDSKKHPESCWANSTNHGTLLPPPQRKQWQVPRRGSGEVPALFDSSGNPDDLYRSVAFARLQQKLNLIQALINYQ